MSPTHRRFKIHALCNARRNGTGKRTTRSMSMTRRNPRRAVYVLITIWEDQKILEILSRHMPPLKQNGRGSPLLQDMSCPTHSCQIMNDLTRHDFCFGNIGSHDQGPGQKTGHHSIYGVISQKS